jgi:hypothetical protein
MLSRTLVTQSTTAIACYATMPVVCNPDPRLQNRNQIAIVDRSTPLPRMPISRCHRDCTGTTTSTTPVRHRYLMLRLGPSIAMESDRLDREWQRPGFNNRGSTGPVSGEGGGVRRPVRSIIITSNFCSHVPHCMETDHGSCFYGVTACLLWKPITRWMEMRLQTPCAQPPCQISIC